MKIIAGLTLTSIVTFMVIFMFMAQESQGHSSFRNKRNVNDIKESIGIGEKCGASLFGANIKNDDQCSAIAECDCDDSGVKLCTCELSTWFIVVIVVLVLLVLGMVACCVLKALGKLLCCKC